MVNIGGDLDSATGVPHPQYFFVCLPPCRIFVFFEANIAIECFVEHRFFEVDFENGDPDVDLYLYI